ncbi:hypothetical protein BMS3Abin15_00358 [bacterium BMS3Abin15]|nr:hypothetical protein BMS3Abin15_00358 [bacterium BMS3Abin15]
MNYIVIAIIAYFILALSFVLDKFLLSDRIPKPSVYAFYVALLSFVSLVLAPFGFYLQSFDLFVSSIVSGMLFIYAILFFYRSVKVNEISRVAPLIGLVLVITTSFISIIFLGDVFTQIDLWGMFFLLIGGFLISFDLPIKSLKIFNGFYNSLISGVLFAVAYSIFKYVYNNDIFVNGFIWTRMGLFAGGLSLLTIPAFREEIVSSLKGFRKNKKKNLSTAVIFIGNKALGGGYSILMSYAVYLGNVAIVNALSSVQFVFVLILASVASLKFPELFGEKLFFWDWTQKIGAILLIGIGIVLVSI